MDFFTFQIEPDEEYGSPSHRIYLRQMRAAIRQAVAEAFALKVRVNVAEHYIAHSPGFTRDESPKKDALRHHCESAHGGKFDPRCPGCRETKERYS